MGNESGQGLYVVCKLTINLVTSIRIEIRLWVGPQSRNVSRRTEDSGTILERTKSEDGLTLETWNVPHVTWGTVVTTITYGREREFFDVTPLIK